MSAIVFFVPGLPAPQGSKKAFYVKALGRAVLTESCKKLKPWRAVVSMVAQQTMCGFPPENGPAKVEVEFRFPRPKNHFGSGKNSNVLKSDAPTFKVSKPDIDKLLRGILDGLTGIVFNDDSQVCTISSSKIYSDAPGAQIAVEFK